MLHFQTIRSLCEDSGKLRIVVASTAFGMGVDCANILEVIHWGPPTTLDTYIQETGRAGRDGHCAVARLLYGHASMYVTESVKLYGQNSTICRKNFLYQNYLFSADAPQLLQQFRAVTYVHKLVNVTFAPLNYKQLMINNVHVVLCKDK